MTTSKLARDRARGLLLSTFEKATILTKVNMISDDRFTIETKDWDSYWQSIYELDNNKLVISLEALHTAWIDYLHSSTDKEKKRGYCYRYFSFLNSVLTHRFSYEEEVWRRALQTTLGFECFGITSFSSGSEVLLAGTSTMRNPCYLLAKLKYPDAMDDSRLLPLITVNEESPGLFYHYRQYSLSIDSENSLLLYPIVEQEQRSRSIQLLNQVASALKYSADPWTKERGELLFKKIIEQIIRQEIQTDTKFPLLSFIDIGAGSGSLVSCLVKKVQKMEQWYRTIPKFHLVSVDLEPSDPLRFLSDKSIRKSVDTVESFGCEYRMWFSQQRLSSQTHGLKFAFLSKLLNACSDFDLTMLGQAQLSEVFDQQFTIDDIESTLPHLNMSEHGIGVEHLTISNTQKYVQNTRIYLVLSLSQFYHSLALSTRRIDEESFGKVVVLPSRKFNQQSLVNSEGKSVIQNILSVCNYLIIIDMDLSPPDVIQHMADFSLDSIIVCDMTKIMRLKNSYAYVLSLQDVSNQLILQGEIIWKL